jgi:hypothetical protein
MQNPWRAHTQVRPYVSKLRIPFQRLELMRGTRG